MNNLEIRSESMILKMNLEKQKILIGSNYQKKYEITRALCSFIRKESLSEFTQENNLEITVNFDGSRLDARRWGIFLINPWLDFDEELKMGSKSIVIKFLEACLSDIESDDNFQCLRTTISMISNETLRSISDIFDEELLLSFSIDDFSYKSLLKLIASNLLKEGYSARDYNLNFDEKISLYITMIELIARKNQGSNYMIVIDSHDYTRKLKKSIEKLPENCKSIIISASILCPVNYNDVLVVGKKDLDLGNENDLFINICLDSADVVDMDQTKNELESLFAHSFQIMHTNKKIQHIL